MRREPCVLVVACLLVGACSGSGDPVDDGTPTTSAPSAEVAGEAVPSETGPGDAGVDAADGVGASDPPSGRVWERPDGPALPGLLDPSDEELPNDPAVRTGRLDNGLRYYVRFNDNPGAKAELRLAIRAGSVDETGPTTGVAHYVEHMLFNGTERFPENELVDVLRGFGAAFGADINAYTSFDETVYQLTVPNDDDALALGLDVLEQWLSHATIADDQVEAERGVVLDEWRVRTQSNTGRLFEVAQELFLAGTPYEGRAPIGTDASIAAMSQAELRDYYDHWYRPDNAAIVAVGDIDVDAIVADIERVFGGAAPRSDAAPDRPDVEFTIEPAPDFGLHLDPDQQTVVVEVTLPLPAGTGAGTAAARAELTDELITDALVRRLEGDLAAGLAPFDRVSRSGNGFVDALDAPALSVVTDAERVDAALLALLDEYERAYRHGFDRDETDLARATVRTFFDTRFEGRDSTQDRVYADEYVDDFLDGSGYLAIDDEHRIATGLLDDLDPAALHERFRARWANSAPHVIISAPTAEAVRIPDRDEVLRVIAGTASRDVGPRGAGRELPPALMDRPEPVDLATIRRLVDDGDELFDPVEMTFGNGATVIVNSNPIVEGQVFLRAASPGGTSLVADADVVDALYAAEVVRSSGVSDFNQAEVAEILAGRDVDLDAWLTPYRENFGGSAATADIESLFQLVHLSMTRPRVDPVTFEQVQRRLAPLIADPGSDPGIAADDALVDARYGGEQRYTIIPDPAEFATLDLAGVERVWRERFGDADGWVFVFVGDVDVDEVFGLAATYLGTLPASGTGEEPVDVAPPPPSGVVEVSVAAGTGDTASVSLLFTSPIDDITPGLRATTNVVTEVIGARLTDVIREELGESYSPFAVSRVVTDPDPAIETFVGVSGSPDRVVSIADLVIAELAELASDGPSRAEFENLYAQVEEAYGFINNGQILTELLDDAVDLHRELDDYLFEFSRLSSVSPDTVRSFVAEHLPVDRYVQVTVVPR